jgi:L-asparagine transporter-like permease
VQLSYNAIVVRWYSEVEAVLTLILIIVLVVLLLGGGGYFWRAR